MITIVNYGLGNVQAFANIYNRLGIPVRFATTTSELKTAERVILPGVGAFDWAMKRLAESGMRECLDDLVLGQEVPVLGVCVGMQMMARTSDEGTVQGLGWVPAVVRRLDGSRCEQKMQVPHMGWNDVVPTQMHPLFRELSGSQFYFLHSYHFQPDTEDVRIATANYMGQFTAAVGRGRICGVQFHPEKSHKWGVQLLRNFAEL
jgi:imidazole glycerol-phosphate synthase subunit HisH